MKVHEKYKGPCNGKGTSERIRVQIKVQVNEYKKKDVDEGASKREQDEVNEGASKREQDEVNEGASKREQDKRYR